MLVPSLACPAHCGYCFGPHAGGKSMRQDTLEAVVRWQEALADQDRLEITFHGGEPLVPGARFYRMALPFLRDGLTPREVRFSLQSNLWLLTDELCELGLMFQIATRMTSWIAVDDSSVIAGDSSRSSPSVQARRTSEPSGSKRT